MPTLKSTLGGFTLVEFIVVLGILFFAIGASLTFLTTLLTGTNRANVTAEVRQNGQAVLDVLDSQIRNSVEVECRNDSGVSVVACTDIAADKNYLKVKRQDSTILHVRCFNDGSTTDNGWIGSVVASDAYAAEWQYSPLTNRDKTWGVDIDACNFKAREAIVGSNTPGLVFLSFVANQGITAPSRVDFQTKIKFETTISLRTYR